MRVTLPKNVEKSIKDYVFKLADKEDYLSTSKIDNGLFIDRLVSDTNAGKKVEQYTKKENVRTYIKDAVLNRYTKHCREKNKPQGLEEFFSLMFNDKCHKIESSKNTTLLRCSSKASYTHIISVDGTYAKWETALRKALLYSGIKPFASKVENRILIHLNLFTPKHVTESDKMAIRKALQIIGAKCDFYGMT